MNWALFLAGISALSVGRLGGVATLTLSIGRFWLFDIVNWACLWHFNIVDWAALASCLDAAAAGSLWKLSRTPIAGMFFFVFVFFGHCCRFFMLFCVVCFFCRRVEFCLIFDVDGTRLTHQLLYVDVYLLFFVLFRF